MDSIELAKLALSLSEPEETTPVVGGTDVDLPAEIEAKFVEFRKLGQELRSFLTKDQALEVGEATEVSSDEELAEEELAYILNIGATPSLLTRERSACYAKHHGNPANLRNCYERVAKRFRTTSVTPGTPGHPGALEAQIDKDARVATEEIHRHERAANEKLAAKDAEIRALKEGRGQVAGPGSDHTSIHPEPGYDPDQFQGYSMQSSDDLFIDKLFGVNGTVSVVQSNVSSEEGVYSFSDKDGWGFKQVTTEINVVKK